MTSFPPEEHDNRELALYGIELSHMCDSPEEDNLIYRHIAESQVYALLDIADAIREIGAAFNATGHLVNVKVDAAKTAEVVARQMEHSADLKDATLRADQGGEQA